MDVNLFMELAEWPRAGTIDIFTRIPEFPIQIPESAISKRTSELIYFVIRIIRTPAKEPKCNGVTLNRFHLSGVIF